MRIQDYDWFALGEQRAPDGLALALKAKAVANTDPAAALRLIDQLRATSPAGWKAWCDSVGHQIHRDLTGAAA